jgi:putative hydrolase
MADRPRDPGDPSEPSLGDVMGDVPLLRELQRVIFSSTGPINWELARQVGIATASWGVDDAAPTDGDRQMLAEGVRVAELAVGDFTGLPAPSDVPHVEAVRRAQWVEANTESMREFLDPVASRLGAAMGEAQAQQLGGLGLGGPIPGMPSEGGMPGMPEGVEGAQFLGALMERMVPLMLGAQVGAVLGYLGQRVLGQFDLAVPRGGGTLLFVVPNIARFEEDWSLEPMEFREWICLHEVTHRFEFAQPWVREHFLFLVKDLVEHAEIDFSAFERGMEDVDVSNPEALSQILEGMASPFGQAATPEQRLRIARVQAFMSATEGYGDHVMDALGKRMLASYGQIEEALRRHREGRHTEQALERLLGLEMKQEQYRLGERFCERVVEQTDEATLSKMWDSADSLPSMPELEEPTLWLSRIA